MSDDARAIADLVEEKSGMVIRELQLPQIVTALRRLAPQHTPAGVLALPDGPERTVLLDRLVDAMTVKETFFLRHTDELERIDWATMRVRALTAGRPTVRVWSAGCATGEEPYTLALLAAEALGGGVPVDILATDVAPSALRDAERGIYRERSLRLVDDERRRRWFSARPDGLAVRPELRSQVRFRRHNLVTDPLPPEDEAPFDLIVCRNVLIYFRGSTVARVTAGLRAALHRGGALILGTADRLGELPYDPSPDAPSAPAPLSIPALPAVPRAPAPAPPAPPPAPVPPPADAPNDAHAAFEAGAHALEARDAAAAVSLLRRALYLDPDLSVAALQLGRAHELGGDLDAARRSYMRALRLAEAAGDPDARLYDRIGAGDVIAACQARLRALG